MTELREAKNRSMQADYESNAHNKKPGWFNPLKNAKGYSRYFDTLDEMEMMVLKAWSTDPKANISFRSYCPTMAREIKIIGMHLNDEAQILFADEKFQTYKRHSLGTNKNKKFEALAQLEILLAETDLGKFIAKDGSELVDLSVLSDRDKANLAKQRFPEIDEKEALTQFEALLETKGNVKFSTEDGTKFTVLAHLSNQDRSRLAKKKFADANKAQAFDLFKSIDAKELPGNIKTLFNQLKDPALVLREHLLQVGDKDIGLLYQN